MEIMVVKLLVSFILGGLVFSMWTRNRITKELEEVRRKENNQKMWQQLLMKGGEDEEDE